MIGSLSGAPACVMPANGAASAAASADAGNGANASAGSASSRAGGEPAAQPPAADGSTSRATTSVNAAVKRDAAQDGQDRAGAPPSDFAALLAAGSAGETPASPPASASAPAPTVAESGADDPAAASLPDQLLALLSGSWAMPAAANAAPAGKPALTGNASAPPTLPAKADAGQSGGLPLAAAMPATGSAVSDTAGTVPASPGALGAAAPGLDSFALLTAAPAGKPALAGNARVPPTPATRNGEAGGLSLAAAAPDHASGPSAALGALAAAVLGTAAERAGSDPGASAADAPSPDSFALVTAASAPAPARAGALPPTTPLALPADPDAGFDDGFGTRIAWMAEQRVGHAQIRLNPEHVGPIDVRVQLDGNRVSAEFHSAHAEVRQAIEASLPRLREMLGQHGLQLGQADVGQRQSGQAARGDGGNSGFGASSDETREPADTAAHLRSRGLLDEYA